MNPEAKALYVWLQKHAFGCPTCRGGGKCVEALKAVREVRRLRRQ